VSRDFLLLFVYACLVMLYVVMTYVSAHVIGLYSGTVTSRTPAKETRDYEAVTYKDSSDLTYTLEKTTMTLPYF